MAYLVLNGHTVNVDGKPIIVPDSFTARTFQDQINTAHFAASAGPDGWAAFLAQNFWWGGSGDLQRPTGALGGFHGTYTPAAAYLYGASAKSSGLTLDQALSAAGILNRLSPSKGSNPYGLPADRVKQITQAYADYNNKVYAPDSSTPLSTILSIFGKDLQNDLPFVGAIIGRLKQIAQGTPKSPSQKSSPPAGERNPIKPPRVGSSTATPESLYHPVVWEANNNGTFYNPRLRIRNQHGKVLQRQQPPGKPQNLPPVSFRRRNPLYVSVDTLNPGYYNDDGIPHVQTSTSAKIVGYGSPYDNTNTPGATSNALQPLLQTNNIISPGAQAKTLPALVPPFIPPPVLLPSDEPIGPPSEPPQVFDQIIIDIGDGDG